MTREATQPSWPKSEECDWSFEDEGHYAGLQGVQTVDYGSCWPKVPGGTSKLAWRFESEGAYWMVEAQLMGEEGLAQEGLSLLLEAMRFQNK